MVGGSLYVELWIVSYRRLFYIQNNFDDVRTDRIEINRYMKRIHHYIFFAAVAILIAWGCRGSDSDKVHEAADHNTQAALLFSRQDYVKSLAEINRAINLNGELARDSALGENYLLQALCLRKLGQYDSSISAFRISLEYFHHAGDQRLERRGRVALAELFYALGRYKDALSLASDAAGEAKVFSDISNVSHALIVVANASHQLKNFAREFSVIDELSRMDGQPGSEVQKIDLLKMSFSASIAVCAGGWLSRITNSSFTYRLE